MGAEEMSRRASEIMDPEGLTMTGLATDHIAVWQGVVDTRRLAQAGLTYELAREGALARGVTRLPDAVRIEVNAEARKAGAAINRQPYPRGICAYFAVMAEQRGEN